MHDLNKAQIVKLFQFDNTARVISDAYVASSSGHVQTGDVVHLSFPESNGDCHVKSGHIRNTDSYVIKIASGFYDNPSKGLPSSNGMMLAFSATTGEPTAILRDEGWLTDMRTGIGGAIATRALAAKNAKKVLIIGSGIQAQFQAKCLASLMPERSFNFNIWGRNESAVTVLVEELRSQSASLLVCDMMSQSLNHGEFQVINDTDLSKKVVELGNILSNSCAGRTSDNDITIADLTGIAAQDIAITSGIIDAAAFGK